MEEHDVRLRQAALHIVLADENKDFHGPHHTGEHWFRAGTLFHWCVRDCARRWDFPVGGNPVDATWERMHELIRGIRQRLSEAQ